MEFLPVCDDNLKKAANILRSGGLVAFPTETVYGLGADAFNPQALAKVFEVKNRPQFDPLIIHIAALDSLESVANLSLLTEETRKKLFLLAENFWPGPLSIVLPKNEKIPGLATAGLNTAAIRFPSHPAAIKLISLSGTAVAAPSANPFGSLSPTRAEPVRDSLGEKIDMILDGGATNIGLESTVLDITGEKVKILRPGGTPKEAIEDMIGEKVQDGWQEDKADAMSSCEVALSPGMMKSHYAPKTPLFALLKEEMLSLPPDPDAAYLFFDGPALSPGSDKIRALSPNGSLREAAACFFETLRELDSMEISRIYAEFAPNQGLGTAINDRLRRASSSPVSGEFPKIAKN